MSIVKRSSIALVSLAMVGAAAPAFAHDYNRDIDKRQVDQAVAIAAGRQDGSLTWFEAFKLHREQKRIAKLEAAAKADGAYTSAERRVIRDAQQLAWRHIREEKHDADQRGFIWRNVLR